MLKHRRILVGVCGGIAAYKVCGVVSQLFQQGAEIRVILTISAQQFVTPLSFSTLSRHCAYTDQDFWHPAQPRPLHIELGEWAELFLIAPLTAQTLAKLAQGLADNLLTNTVLASRCPVLVAPAMNTDMWEQYSVQRNWHQLHQDPRYHSLEPSEGLLACDRQGKGRMAEPVSIVTRLQSMSLSAARRDLVGKTLLISAGGTQEYLDPVRFLGNPSTGKMGLALAQAAADRGAKVILIHGPLYCPEGDVLSRCQAIAVINAAQMESALNEHCGQANWIIMAAAVADVKPAHYSSTKLAKADLPSSLELVPVPDLVAQLSRKKRPDQVLVGFAAQTGDIITPAQQKLERKGLDLIVANPIDQAGCGFGSDTNQVVILDRWGNKMAIVPSHKLAIAHQLWDYILEKFPA